jgi:thiol-disulfide isomerase/thioredoxin
MPMGVRWRSLSLLLAGMLALGLGCAAISTDAHAQSVGARPWLGVAMDPDVRGPGVRVGHVVRGSPADKAGLREGDRMLSVAGAAIGGSADVVRTVAAHAVGDRIEISFARAGEQRVAKVTFASFPSQDDMLRMDLVGTFAPAWKDVETVSGAFPRSIGELRGRVVLLDFWATWCAPCRIVIPKLGALQARYGAQGLSILGMSTEEASDVALFAQRMAMPYPVAIDRHAATTRTYGVASLPTLVVIDKRGVVRDVAIGYDSSEDAHLEDAVRALLAEPAPND